MLEDYFDVLVGAHVVIGKQSLRNVLFYLTGVSSVLVSRKVG